MKRMRAWTIASAVLLVAASHARAQGDAAAPHPAPADAAAPHAARGDAAEHPWELSLSVFTYDVPHGKSYVSPILVAERGDLHLEARYNYEALDTGSLFVGWNFHHAFFDDALAMKLTPLVGGVVGHVNGVAPGCEIDLAYSRFDLYTEAEYLFDVDDHENNFFYDWSQLTWAPNDTLKLGLVAQRTRAYHTDLDVQRGILFGVTLKHLELTAYVFNLGWETPTYVLSLGFGF
jgi:hypothetical protein